MTKSYQLAYNTLQMNSDVIQQRSLTKTSDGKKDSAALNPSSVQEPEFITVLGAEEHNLKIDRLDIPKKCLVVFTGVSGSGKSSLAFDTLYAEGQRRYVESLSAYARQFLGQMDKPKYESIRGLSPTIAIEQKSSSSNPRSTVGTVTEIYDYLRVLFARAGEQRCYQCGREVAGQSAGEIVESLMRLVTQAEGQPVQITLLAPMTQNRKGTHQEIFEAAAQSGFARVRINGEIMRLEEVPALSKKHKHSIDIVTDRIVIRENDAETRRRLLDSVEATLKAGQGVLLVAPETGGEAQPEYMVSETRSCPDCGIAFPDLSPASFSFNSPLGMCSACTGLGTRMEMDPYLLIPDGSLSIEQGAIIPWTSALQRGEGWVYSLVQTLSRDLEIDLKKPWNELPKDKQDMILYGVDRKQVRGVDKRTLRFEGILNLLMRRYRETTSDWMRIYYGRFMREVPCSSCEGQRLRPESRAVYLMDGQTSSSLGDICRKTVQDAAHFFKTLHLAGSRALIASELIKEINARLGFLVNVGLTYLSLDRAAATLSGGEAQRIRLASQLGSDLSGVMYVLDEPSIGLHQRDNRKLIQTLQRLRDQGNSVLVVEHDTETMLDADWVIDFGPGAGKHGGHVIFSGTPKQLLEDPQSVTGAYLSGRKKIEVPQKRREPKGFLKILGAKEHNLRNIDVKLPLGVLCAVTGVSGAGKSSLINGILHPALMNALHQSNLPVGQHDKIMGLDQLDKIIAIDQQPIGRTPRSNPATYTKAFDLIRDLFSKLPESKAYGYAPGRFSFNVKGGRCEACEGDGVKRVEMHFLADVFVPCEVCKGKRYNEGTLRVRFKNQSIADVLDASVEQAKALFANQPGLMNILNTLDDVGLSYLSLGQPAPTLSGGEAQRIKLAKELCRRDTGKTLYLLDEPTTGLHFEDVRRLLGVLQRLVEAGNTVLVIEHNLDVIKCADYVLDLGPEGGQGGGQVLAAGTPEEVAKTKGSYTGTYLAEML